MAAFTHKFRRMWELRLTWEDSWDAWKATVAPHLYYSGGDPFDEGEDLREDRETFYWTLCGICSLRIREDELNVYDWE